MNRAGMVCVAVCIAGVALVTEGAGAILRAQQGARVIQMAELPDMALGAFHNSLFRSAFDHIVDDHGVRLGSLGSDLFHDPDDSYNEFWTVTDRGPNGNPGRRTFVAPKFNPVILYIRVQDQIRILQALPIVDTPYDFSGTNLIAGNPNGLDTEGILRTRNGHFWLADEYSPSLVHVNKDGRIIERFVPEESLLGTTLANTPNYVVKKYLPRILNYRRQNRGFEGIAVTPDERSLFIAMQSPLDYPTSALGRASRNVRILRFAIGSERVTGDFVYHFDEVCAFLGEVAGCGVAPGEMKISGGLATNSGRSCCTRMRLAGCSKRRSRCPVYARRRTGCWGVTFRIFRPAVGSRAWR